MSELVQTINFYQDVFRKPKVVFPFQKMLIASSVMLLVLMMYCLVDYSRIISNRQNHEKQILAKSRLENSVNKLQVAVDARVEDPVLKKREKTLRENLQMKYRFLSAIKKQSNSHSLPFSGFLKGLSNIENQHIWLTNIKIKSPGPDISLSGMTDKAEAVPVYISQFKGDDHFKGMGFRVFNAERMEKNSDFMIFNINTQHEQSN